MSRGTQFIIRPELSTLRGSKLYSRASRTVPKSTRGLIELYQRLHATLPHLRPLTFTPKQLGFRSLSECEEQLGQSSNAARLTNKIDHEAGLVVQTPMIEEGAYVDPQADILGGVVIRSGCYIAPHVSVRMDEKLDLEPLQIEKNTNLQDHVLVHAHPKKIGTSVIIAHSAVIHGCSVGDDVAIYIKAVIDTDASVGDGCFIDANAYIGRGVVVPPKRYIAPGLYVTSDEQAQGLPDVSEEQQEVYRNVMENNASHARKYLDIQRGEVEDLVKRIDVLSRDLDG